MRRAVLALLLLAACVTGRTTGGGPKGPRGPEEEYQAGVKQLQSHDWLDAQRTLDQVRTRYPYSRFAALAELRLADGKFDQDKFVEAAEAYQQFVKLHPNHEEVDYASYRVGLSRWKDAPSGFFLLPPVYERDMTPVVAAITALEAFLKSYPKSKYVPEAEKLMAEAKGLFVERDWYVAGFYRNRDRWEGVAFRMEHLLKEYPGSRYESRALYQLAEAYLKMNERYRAQQALQQLIVKHPDDPLRPKAEKLLAGLR